MSVIPITTDTYHQIKQSELEADTGNRCQGKRVWQRHSCFGFTSDWLQNGNIIDQTKNVITLLRTKSEALNLSKNNVKQVHCFGVIYQFLAPKFNIQLLFIFLT